MVVIRGSRGSRGLQCMQPTTPTVTPLLLIQRWIFRTCHAVRKVLVGVPYCTHNKLFLYILTKVSTWYFQSRVIQACYPWTCVIVVGVVVCKVVGALLSLLFGSKCANLDGGDWVSAAVGGRGGSIGEEEGVGSIGSTKARNRDSETINQPTQLELCCTITACTVHSTTTTRKGLATRYVYHIRMQ